MSHREDLLYLLHNLSIEVDYEDEDYMYFYTTNRFDIKDLTKHGHKCTPLTDITCPPIYCRVEKDSQSTTQTTTVSSSHA